VKIKSYVAVSFNEYETSWQSSPMCWAKNWTAVTRSSWQRRRGRSVYEPKPTFSEGLERDRHFLSSISDVPQSMTRNVFKQEYHTCNLLEKKVKQTTLTSFSETQWPLIRVCELYHEVHIVWSSFHEIKNLLYNYLLTVYFLINYESRPKA